MREKAQALALRQGSDAAGPGTMMVFRSQWISVVRPGNPSVQD